MNVEIASSIASRLRGLLGREGFEGVLLLMPCNDVHTYGLCKTLDIAFVASDGTVIESYRGVGSRCRLRCAAASITMERFARETPWFERGDHVDLKDCFCEKGRYL